LAGVVAALIVPFTLFDLPTTGTAFLAVTLLAAPFVVLTAATALLAHRRSAAIVLGLLCFLSFLPWFFSLFIMAWFKPGLLGATALGGLMGLVALALVLLVHLVTRSRPVQGKT